PLEARDRCALHPTIDKKPGGRVADRKARDALLELEGIHVDIEFLFRGKRGDRQERDGCRYRDRRCHATPVARKNLASFPDCGHQAPLARLMCRLRRLLTRRLVVKYGEAIARTVLGV